MYQLVWFKRDLRVGDHWPLVAAREAGPVLPIYVVEPDLWKQPDYSGRQWSFFADCLHRLREDLTQLGAPLVVRIGNVVEIFEWLRTSVGIEAVWSHQETGNSWTYERDKAVGVWTQQHGIRWTECRQHGVIRPLTSRTGWAKKWDALMRRPVAPPVHAVRARITLDPGKIPDEASIDLIPDPCPHRQSGGSKQAHALLASFLKTRGRAYHKEMSSPLTAQQSCSRLSPHLAAGTISIREVTQAIWKRLADLRKLPKQETGSWPAALNAYAGRLHWHCHFMQKLEDAPAHEFRNVHSGYDGIREEAFDPKHFDAWTMGQTGFPFIDACMRSLNATGWINFRMRAMLMAFASYHLWLHWRETGLHLARQFVDYEPGIHWNQVQMQSGTTGINTVRVYNPVKQSYDQDPDGRFIRRWVPELASVPLIALHEPWKMGGLEQMAVRCRLGIDYPERIVDHLDAARHARQRVYGVRKSAAFRDEAAAIQDRHGSRKGGIPRAGRKPKARKASNTVSVQPVPDS